jgi:hypothetical protein
VLIARFKLKTPTVTEEDILRLHLVFSEDMLIAAFDIVDRGSGLYDQCVLILHVLKLGSYVCHPIVIKHTTSWNRSHYEVFGSTGSYLVYPEINNRTFGATISEDEMKLVTPQPAFCTCPTYMHSVLLSQDPIIMVCIVLFLYQ